ncbi:MAG: hypothetical protein ACK41E_00585 [Deinococcales bacterium]
MPSVHFVPSEASEYKLRLLTRGQTEKRVSEVWELSGWLELELGLKAPLRLSCSNPVRHGLEPLLELAQWVKTGRGSFFSRVLGTASLGNSHHLYVRWRGHYDAVLLLGERDSTVGLQKNDDAFHLTVLETDDQPELEDTSTKLTQGELLELPRLLWQDLDALLRLLGVELEDRQLQKWERYRGF